MLSALYLGLYNLCSALGWGYIDYLLVNHLFIEGKCVPVGRGTRTLCIMEVLTHGGLLLISTFGRPLDEVYDTIEMPLKIVQTAAVLEIVHSMLKLVRSPVFTTVIQVSSRLFLVWAVSHWAPPGRQSLFFALMAGSWALVEVPRYAFYMIKDATSTKENPNGALPYWLIWLRYSLFLVLYPTGISGAFRANSLKHLVYCSWGTLVRVIIMLGCPVAGEIGVVVTSLPWFMSTGVRA